MLQRAVELSPRDGMIIDSLGWAYYRLGRYDDAVRELEKAVELKPGDPVINDHLGDAYWKVGRKLEAQVPMAARQGLRTPSPRTSEKIVAKLQKGLARGKARRGKCAGRGEERGLRPPLPDGRGAGARVSRCRRKGAPVLPVMAHMLQPSPA